MDFIEMRNKLIENFNEITKDVTHLFEVEVDKEDLWNTYLDAFPKGTNEIYRERREHDCSCCRHFIKTIGNAVVIKDKKHMVSSAYVSKLKKIGTLKNYEEMEDGTIHEWSHFFLELPDKFVDKSIRFIREFLINDKEV